MYFSEDVTEEELVLAKLQGHNPYTAAQMISFAYTEGLPFDAVLDQCADAQGVQRICHGVGGRMAATMAAEIREAQKDAHISAHDVHHCAATDKLGRSDVLEGVKPNADFTNTPALHTALHHSSIANGRDAVDHVDGREMAAFPTGSHKAVTIVTPIAERPEPQSPHLSQQPPSDVSALHQCMQLQTDDAQQRGMRRQAAEGGACKVHACVPPHTASPLQASLIHAAMHDTISRESPDRPSPMDTGKIIRSKGLTAHCQAGGANGKSSRPRKRPFSCLKDTSVTVNRNLLPPEIGFGKKCEPRCLSVTPAHTGVPWVGTSLLRAESPGLIQADPWPKSNVNTSALHPNDAPGPSQKRQRQLESGLDATPKPHRSSVGEATALSLVQECSPDVLQWDTSLQTDEDSDISLDDGHLQTLLRTQGTHCNTKAHQVLLECTFETETDPSLNYKQGLIKPECFFSQEVPDRRYSKPHSAESPTASELDWLESPKMDHRHRSQCAIRNLDIPATMATADLDSLLKPAEVKAGQRGCIAAWSGSPPWPKPTRMTARHHKSFHEGHKASTQLLLPVRPSPSHRPTPYTSAAAGAPHEVLPEARPGGRTKPRLSSFACDIALGKGARPRSSTLAAALSKGKKRRFGNRHH